MLDRWAGAWLRRLLDPPAARLLAWGVSPDAVTLVGTLGVVAASLGLIATGALAAGALVVGVCALADTLDGTLARLARRPTAWGAFLDSTLDRVADAAVLAALVVWSARRGDDTGLVLAVACLAGAGLVPYVRARGEALGVSTPDGVAARADRLAVTLAAVLAVGLGAPVWVLHGALVLLLVGIALTVAHRMLAVRRRLTGAMVPVPR